MFVLSQHRILNYPSRGKLKTYEVRDSIKQAFGVWADVTPLEFQELEGSSAADIRVGFFRGSHSYDKDHPMFDGPNGELAHAFSPNSGWGDVCLSCCFIRSGRCDSGGDPAPRGPRSSSRP